MLIGEVVRPWRKWRRRRIVWKPTRTPPGILKLRTISRVPGEGEGVGEAEEAEEAGEDVYREDLLLNR